MEHVEFILHVSDQNRSRDFYERVLQIEPALDVPGKTEFRFGGNRILDILPQRADNPTEESERRAPQCAVYLVVADIEACYNRALSSGGRAVSRIQPRAWGDPVAYVQDPDGHLVGIAQYRERTF